MWNLRGPDLPHAISTARRLIADQHHDPAHHWISLLNMEADVVTL
ncbi:MAG TPA: hypothetical protein VGI45_08905 [Terracidiphilus sp.]